MSTAILLVLCTNGNDCYVGIFRRIICQIHFCPSVVSCSTVCRFCTVTDICLNASNKGCFDGNRLALNFGGIIIYLGMKRRIQGNFAVVTVMHNQSIKSYCTVYSKTVNITIRLNKICCAVSQRSHQELYNMGRPHRD